MEGHTNSEPSFYIPPTLEKEKLGPKKKKKNKIIQKDDGKYQRQVNDQRASERAIRHDKYEPSSLVRKEKKRKKTL